MKRLVISRAETGNSCIYGDLRALLSRLSFVQEDWRPMPLLRAPAPFDHPDWLFELKHDGFRALAIIEGHRCRLVSRQRHDFRQWPQLAEELAHAVRVDHAVLDGEIVCLRRNGLSDFYALMFRRDSPFFYAFDALSIDGDDLRELPLLERKRRLARAMPQPDLQARVRYMDHVVGRGRDLFRLVCQKDAEGIVAKWMRGRYRADGATTSWLKVKNPRYSQAVGRHDFFEGRGPAHAALATRRLDPVAFTAARRGPAGGRGTLRR
jgi:bifunctional non-homologous end joining protein LigD